MKEVMWGKKSLKCSYINEILELWEISSKGQWEASVDWEKGEYVATVLEESAQQCREEN